MCNKLHTLPSYMPANDKTMVVVREWVAKAENDLKSAVYLLKMKDCPVENVCFNAQQCVEKYLKALLLLRVTPVITNQYQ